MRDATERREQINKNIRIIGALHGAGLPVELSTVFGARPIVAQTPPRKLTQQDLDRIAAAEAKRQRKAAKLSAHMEAANG